MKKCIKCGIKKPDSIDIFIGKKTSKSGIGSTCRECHNAYNKAYRESHREHISAYTKSYYRDNKDSIKIWREKNKEQIALKAKEYNASHRAEVLLKRQTYRKHNREEVLNKEKSYRENNKEGIALSLRKYSQCNREKRNTNHNKYIAKRNKLLHTLTTEQWEYVRNYFNNKCVYCGEEKRLSQEHFYPLSLGGEFTVSNILCACHSCNSSKGAKIFSEWYPIQPYYSKQREENILRYLKYNNNIQQLSFA